MKSFGLIFCLAICLLAAAQRACAQSASQLLSFSIVGQYQIDIFGTNVPLEETNQEARIRGVWITTTNVVKALAVDLEGLHWTNWEGAALVRKTDLTTGAEGIFMIKGAVQTNVSSFFGDSFSNNFKADIGGDLGGFTNTLFYDNGLETNITNSVYTADLSTVSTNATIINPILTPRSASLFSVSLNTSNLKFNVLAFGVTVGTDLVLTYKGTHYAQWVDTVAATGVGNFAINLGTNLFFGPDLNQTTNFVSGPAHGSFDCYAPVFSVLPGP